MIVVSTSEQISLQQSLTLLKASLFLRAEALTCAALLALVEDPGESFDLTMLKRRQTRAELAQEGKLVEIDAC